LVWLILRNDHILKVFEKRMLRRIFEPKSDKIIEGCRKLHNEERHNLYYSPNIIRLIKPRRIQLAGHVAYME
jgi:hypothetical protein